MEDQVKKEYRPFDASVIRTGGASEFDDYVQLPTEEAVAGNITKLELGKKFNRTKGVDEDRLYVHVKLSEGPGAGQTYRGDFSPVVTSTPKQSNLAKFLEKVYGEPQTSVPVVDGDSSQPEMIGRPIRIELSEPWGDKGLQFIKEFKKPLASQKRVEAVVADVIPEETMSDEEVSALFDGAAK